MRVRASIELPPAEHSPVELSSIEPPPSESLVELSESSSNDMEENDDDIEEIDYYEDSNTNQVSQEQQTPSRVPLMQRAPHQ